MAQQCWELEDPWLPIVLSLDGGGVRGLSTLYVLRRIMRKIQERVKAENDDPVTKAMAANRPSATRTPALADHDLIFSSVEHYQPRRPAPTLIRAEHQASALNLGSGPPAECSAELPLPCWYFDYMVGTSTGGLIAVMLGRLRMSVDDAIKQYWILSNYVFRPPRFPFLRYDAVKLEKGIKGVIREFCGCHLEGRSCSAEGPDELLRQYDYAEEGDPAATDRLNYSCKVALVAHRYRRQGGDATYLFRSYNHNERLVNWAPELNPGTLGPGSAKIWEACRASAAAPLVFKQMIIDDNRYVDGGVGNKNPANLAWNEARWMSNRLDPHNGKVTALVSLGTGMSRGETRFGVINLLHWARMAITETTSVHEEVRDRAVSSGAAYWRFDVKPEDGFHDGLTSVRLSHCKRRKLVKRGVSRAKRENSPASSTSDDMDWHRALQEEAMAKRNDKGKRPKGAYKPDKYAYETFDLIFQRTEQYCTHSPYDDNISVDKAIDECAELLLKCARLRLLADPARFSRFVSHPHPKHDKYLPHSEQPQQVPSDRTNKRVAASI